MLCWTNNALDARKVQEKNIIMDLWIFTITRISLIPYGTPCTHMENHKIHQIFASLYGGLY